MWLHSDWSEEEVYQMALRGMRPLEPVRPMFGEELDDRGRLVALVTAGYTPTPLNALPDPCPVCSGQTYIVCMMRRQWDGYMFRSCRACGYAKCEYDSTTRK